MISSELMREKFVYQASCRMQFEIIGLISSKRPGMVTVCCTTGLITVAFVALDYRKMASPGDGDRDFGIHAL